MLDYIKPENILFLDIETVPQYANFEELKEPFSDLWDKKSVYFRKEDEGPADVYERAGIYAEFGKIVCISVGVITSGAERKFVLKSFFNDDERLLLEEFFQVLRSHIKGDDYYLCAHNGKEFDYPYIARRALIKGLHLPAVLDVAGKKPWETKQLLDTMEMWKFGDYKNFTSLNLLAAVFGIPSPKDDIAGNDVARVYYQEKDVQRIVVYCEKDVLTIAQLLLRYKGLPMIDAGKIESKTQFNQ